jgi:uncharacterized repeat protein (TIGR03803 family)
MKTWFQNQLALPVLAAGLALILPGQLTGQTFTTIHSFSSTSDGANPGASLILSGNTLYGTASQGGSFGYGTVFKVNADGTGYTTLYSFTDGNDGGNPSASLILSGNTLYGTAASGGSSANVAGTVFKVTTNGTGFTTLYSFTGGSDGASPYAALVLSGNTLYGTTVGPNYETGLGGGTVFKVTTNGTGFATLHTFIGTPMYPETNTDGQSPLSLLLSGNTLYGTTSGGGMQFGTVFAVNTNGAGFKSLYVFTGSNEGNAPLGGLILSGNTLYGTSAGNDDLGLGYSAGDLNTNGSVFTLNTNGTDFTVVHSFTATSGSSFTNSDGANPSAGLILSDDTLYGTTPSGGGSGNGTVFAVKTNGTGFTTLYSFTATNDNGWIVVGAMVGPNVPYAGLVLSGRTLYGAAGYGGIWSNGTIFALSTNGTGFATLHDFAGQSLNSDGANPSARLILSGSTLYGTARQGGISGGGTVFAVNTNGTAFATLYAFTNGSDGANPFAGLILSGNTLYGTAASGGGSSAGGTVFAVNTNGKGFTTLHGFAVATYMYGHK